MFGPSGESERRRTRLMPAVLFGLLLLSVAVAAWLVYSRGVPVRRAAELLAEIRGKGLAQFFPASASRWFLIQSEGKTVGWQLARSHRRNDARFEGIHVMYVWGGPGIHAFSFALLAGVLFGTYSSVAVATPLLMAFRGALGAKIRKGPESGRAAKE